MRIRGSNFHLILNDVIIFIFISINHPLPTNGISCYKCHGHLQQEQCTKIDAMVNCGKLHCVTRTKEFSNGTRVTSRGCSSCVARRDSLIPFMDKTVGCPDTKCMMTHHKIEKPVDADGGLEDSHHNHNLNHYPNLNPNAHTDPNSNSDLHLDSVHEIPLYVESICSCNYDMCNIVPDCRCPPPPEDPASIYYCFLVIFPLCGLLLGFGFKYSDAVGLCLRTVTCTSKKEKIEYTGVTK